MSNIKDQKNGYSWSISIIVILLFFICASVKYELYETKYLYSIGSNLFESLGVIVGFLLALFGLLLGNSNYSKEFIDKVDNDNTYRAIRNKYGSTIDYLKAYKKILLIEVVIQVVRIILTFLVFGLYISIISCNGDVCNFSTHGAIWLFTISGSMIIFLLLNTIKVIGLMFDYLDRTEFYGK